MRIFKIKPLILTALIIAILSLHPCTVMAQTVAVTGTITDTQTTPYSNGLLTVTFVNSTGQQATFGGNPSFQKSYAIYLDANGAFTISLPPNSTASPSIQPAGTQWNFSYQSQGGYGAANINVTITGAGSISGTLSNLARITWPYGNIPPPGASGQGLVFVTSTTLGWGSTGGGGGVPFAAGGGVAQAQTVSPTPAIVALTNGLQVCWLPIAANTAAAPTLSISGLAAKPITKYGIVALVANDITTVAIACAVYDGTEFQLQVPLAGGVYSGSINIGSGASAAGATATGGFACVEAASTGWTPTVGQDYIRCDSTAHTFKSSSNGVAETTLGSGTVNSGLIKQVAYYPVSAAAVSGDAGLTYDTSNSTQLLTVGPGNCGSSDCGIVLARTVTNSTGAGTGNAHGFSDSTAFSRTTGGPDAYSSYHADASMTGGHTFDHYSGFQAAQVYNNAGFTMGASYGFFSTPIVNAGTITSLVHFGVQAPIMGGGAIQAEYGVYLPAMTEGAGCSIFNCNWGIYQPDSALHSYFGGKPIYGSVDFVNAEGVNSTPIDPITISGTQAPAATGTSCQLNLVRPYHSGTSYQETFEICTGRYSAAVAASPNTRVDFNIKGANSDSLVADLTALSMGTDNTDTAAGTFVSTPGNFSAKTYASATNCSSSASPAVCGSAAAGSVAVPTGVTPTLVVNTTAVTANSQILFTPDESLGTKLSVTCNSTIAQVAIEPIVTARTAATSFTIQYNTTITVNPICLSYLIVN